MTDHSALAAAVNEAAGALGVLDAVVTVAAGRGTVGSTMTGSPERWRELLDLNLVAPLATVQQVVGHFGSEGRREVVLVGSTAALTPMVGLGVYGRRSGGCGRPGGGAGAPGPLGVVIASVLGLPEGIGIDEVVGRPTGQLNP